MPRGRPSLPLPRASLSLPSAARRPAVGDPEPGCIDCMKRRAGGEHVVCIECLCDRDFPPHCGLCHAHASQCRDEPVPAEVLEPPMSEFGQQDWQKVGAATRPSNPSPKKKKRVQAKTAILIPLAEQLLLTGMSFGPMGWKYHFTQSCPRDGGVTESTLTNPSMQWKKYPTFIEQATMLHKQSYGRMPACLPNARMTADERSGKEIAALREEVRAQNESLDRQTMDLSRQTEQLRGHCELLVEVENMHQDLALAEEVRADLEQKLESSRTELHLTQSGLPTPDINGSEPAPEDDAEKMGNGEAPPPVSNLSLNMDTEELLH